MCVLSKTLHISPALVILARYCCFGFGYAMQTSVICDLGSWHLFWHLAFLELNVDKLHCSQNLLVNIWLHNLRVYV